MMAASRRVGAMAGGGGSTVYLFPHLPRTAGNTIAAHLEAHLPKGQVLRPAKASAPAALFGSRYRLGSDVHFDAVRAVSGHWLGRSLLRRFAGREVRPALLLRDPVGFHVSYYNHRMMFSLSRGGPTCSFSQHLGRQPRDLVAMLLLWYWLELPLRTIAATGDAAKYRLANAALGRFWFVGGYHQCDRLMAEVAADLGVPAAAPRRNTTLEWQERVGWQPLREADLSPGMRSAILAQNPIHDALWHSWRDAGFAPAATALRPFRPGAAGGLGVRDLVRGVLADRFLAPVWRQAAAAGREGRWPRAARLYRKALRRWPLSPEAWVQYGHALTELGRLAAAEAAYRRALDLDRGMAAAHLFLGHALMRQARTAEAGEAYRRFAALDPAALARQRDEAVAHGWSEAAFRARWRELTGNPGSE